MNIITHAPRQASPEQPQASQAALPNTPYFLLIDAGNTRIKWALYQHGEQNKYNRAGRIDHTGKCSTADVDTALWQALVETKGLSTAIFAVGVCVAGAAVQQTISAHVLQLTGLNVEWLTGTSSLLGLNNAYATPQTLGPDRWLAAYGLLNKWSPTQAYAVLATFGTATTVDVVYWDEAARSHVFAGGLILAGLNTAWRSVSRSTARLPYVSQALLQPGYQLAQQHLNIPNSTDQALLCGALWSQAGAVERMFALAQNRYAKAQTSVQTGALLIAGGDANMMQGQLPQAKRFRYPVFHGLVRWCNVCFAA